MTSPVTDTDLLDGLAQLLAAESVGTYNPDGAYTAGQVGIVIDAVPQEPDEIITLTTYLVTAEDSRLNDAVIGIQVRFRGTLDPRSVRNRSAAVFDVLEGLEDQHFGGIYLALMWRQASGPLPVDELNRRQHADSYYCRVNWPTRHRTE